MCGHYCGGDSGGDLGGGGSQVLVATVVVFVISDDGNSGREVGADGSAGALGGED